MDYSIINATFNLTQQCNLKCSYCFTHGKNNKKMTFEIAKKGINYLIDNIIKIKDENLINGKRGISISFWGGEPLLEWEMIKKIVLYTEKILPENVEVDFSGTTNGVLLTSEKFNFMEDHKLHFLISLDGTPETHNYYRKMLNNEGSHHLVMQNMENCLKKWPFYMARQSIFPERIGYLYEDIKYLIEHGVTSMMFSPVYEGNWENKHWKIYEKQCYKIINLISEYLKKDKHINIAHFDGYCKPSDFESPCGAGQFYAGFDVDGSIWPCHRFIKFNDHRPWQEKEWCIGHLDYGITKPEVRQKFINKYHPYCEKCKYYKTTKCYGGCYAINLELEGDILKPHNGICKNTKILNNVSLEYIKNIESSKTEQTGENCVCYNMCYLENTKNEIKNINLDSGIYCHCYNVQYKGDLNFEKKSRILTYEEKKLIMFDKKDIKIDFHNTIESIESKINKIEKILNI